MHVQVMLYFIFQLYFAVSDHYNALSRPLIDEHYNSIAEAIIALLGMLILLNFALINSHR